MGMKNLLGARILVALLASIAATAQAVPIVFANAQYDTTAFALSGVSADVNSAASPSPLPLVSDAVVVGANDFASASALAASGLLVTSSEADSFAGALGASAGAQSHFVGTILGTGRLILRLDFDSVNTAFGGGTGAGTLFVLLTNTAGATTTTLFNDFFSASNDATLEFVAVGDVSTLDLLLFSEAASAGDGQSGQNFSQVTVAGTIPLPATLPLVLVGFAGMLVVRRKPANGRA